MSIGELIYNSTRDSQSIEAIRYDNKSVTYFDLNDKALSIASLLTKMGFYQSVIGIVGQKTLPSSSAQDHPGVGANDDGNSVPPNKPKDLPTVDPINHQSPDL